MIGLRVRVFSEKRKRRLEYRLLREAFDRLKVTTDSHIQQRLLEYGARRMTDIFLKSIKGLYFCKLKEFSLLRFNKELRYREFVKRRVNRTKQRAFRGLRDNQVSARKERLYQLRASFEIRNQVFEKRRNQFEVLAKKYQDSKQQVSQLKDTKKSLESKIVS